MARVSFGDVSVDMRLVDDYYGIAALKALDAFLIGFSPTYQQVLVNTPTLVVVSLVDAVNQAVTVTLAGDIARGTLTTLSVDAKGVTVVYGGSFAIDAFGNLSGTVNTESAVFSGTLAPIASIAGTSFPFVDSMTVFDPDDAVLLAGADTVLGGGGNDYLLAYAGNDSLAGGAGSDTLDGSSGADTLDGGAGADTLLGGSGNDTYFIDNAADVTTETSTLATEVDTVKSAVSRTLGANLEILRLTGSAAIDGTGNTLANQIFGNAAANVLDGAAGNDFLSGGAGNDTYVVDSALDRIVESLAAYGGVDTVSAGVSWTLGANLETLRLGGTAANAGTGNALANRIFGNTADNVLTGGAGDDTLFGGDGNDVLKGGTGVDRMLGGQGDDSYFADSALDRISETSASGGIDTVNAPTSWALGANLENLNLTGGAASNGFGNALANQIAGNAAANVIVGGGGDDILSGGAGIDSFVFNSLAGTDTITDFVSGSDKFRFSQGSFHIGDGDRQLENASSIAGPGGFSPNAELVIAQQNISGPLTAASAAAAFDAASAAYAVGDSRLLAVDNGTASAVYLFTSNGNDALIGADELTPILVASHTAATTLGDYLLVA